MFSTCRAPIEAIMTRPLADLLVISIEQAVAAPMCTARLADAGARVIKIERSEGDTARHYDGAVHGTSAYFAWLNRGKESIVLDLKSPDDLRIIENMAAKADVFVQNLAPGAAARLGLGCEATCRALSPAHRSRHRRLWRGHILWEQACL
jgi:itaconate CoA-transferase